YLLGIPGVFRTGVEEQGPVEKREDVLVYTSSPLEQDLEVTGNVVLTLWAATSAPDTDWAAKLTDVHPDGNSYNVCDGILRASFRESLEKTTAVEPGEAYEYKIDLGPTAMLFRRGHRIRLQVSSSNYPAFARNLNSGAPHHQGKEARSAIQTVLHDADHPSRLILPVTQG
ncbi:MAG: CocE/NonD family hydrolase, partial [Dehalococcoidia bacterium]